MNNTGDPRIDAFLDGRMDSAEQQAFLDLLEHDAQLRKEFERQCAIDASLRRTHIEPQPEELLDRVEAAIVNSKTGRGGARSTSHKIKTTVRGWRVWAAAALVAFSMLGVWYSWSLTRPPPAVDVYAPQPWRSFATVYHDTIRDGFKPAWICRNEGQFERVFSRRFRQPLLLAAMPSGISAGGISYSNTMSEATINVLGKVDGIPVMIFVDRLTADHGPPPPPPPDLHLFRREINDLVLYELTPLDRPNILPFFYRPK